MSFSGVIIYVSSASYIDTHGNVDVDEPKECPPEVLQISAGTPCIYDKKPVLEPCRGSKDYLFWMSFQEKNGYAEDYEICG